MNNPIIPTSVDPKLISFSILLPNSKFLFPKKYGICLINIIKPIPVSIPLITDEGKYWPITPALRIPNVSWITPPITTAKRKFSNPFNVLIAVRTIAASPAAGPLTPIWEPLNRPTTIPPIIPAIIPENKGAPLARAIPRQRGIATKKTTILAGISDFKLFKKELFISMFLGNFYL